MLYTGIRALYVVTLLQAGRMVSSLIIRRPQVAKCEVEDDLRNHGCTLENLAELELLAMLERRGIDIAGVDISTAIQVLKGLENGGTTMTAVQSSIPSRADNLNSSNDLGCVDSDVHDSVVEEEFVWANGMVKDATIQTPEGVYNVQYPRGYCETPEKARANDEMEDKTNKSNKFEEKSQLGVILKFIIEIGEEMKAQVHSDFTTVLRIVPILIREGLESSGRVARAVVGPGIENTVRHMKSSIQPPYAFICHHVLPKLKATVKICVDAIQEKLTAPAAE